MALSKGQQLAVEHASTYGRRNYAIVPLSDLLTSDEVEALEQEYGRPEVSEGGCYLWDVHLDLEVMRAIETRTLLVDIEAARKELGK